MRKAILAVLPLLLASSGSSGPGDPIGTAVYLEGRVSVVRDGAALSAEEVATGLPIENFDMMKTGDDGSAQVQVNSPQAPASTISVSPDTQFTFELSQLQGKARSSINLISGSLSLKVSALRQDQDLDVQTENTVLGVRGTEFDVNTSVAGDVLVTCTTGAVACTSENGTQYQATPGTAVENQEGGAFRTIPVAASELDSFRRSWIEQRRAAARANAAVLIRLSALRYRQLRTAYDREYEALMRQRAVISRWITEDRQGSLGAVAQVEQEKRAMAATLIRLRRTQFLLERVYYRLLRLKALHDQGYGRGALSGAVTTTRFFDQLEQDRPEIERRMATVRYVVRLYVRRNRDEDPTSYSLRFLRERTLRERRR